MFCSYCGKEIPADAAFCSFCGKATAVGAPPPASVEVPPAQGDPEHPPIRFTVHDRVLEFDWRFEDYMNRRKPFRGHHLLQLSGWENQCKKLIGDLNDSNIDNCLDIFLKFGRASSEWLKKEVHKVLLAEKIYTFTVDQVEAMLAERMTNFPHAYEDLFKQYSATIASERELEEYRSAQRANRGRWQGGGFGVEGAVRGAMTAGMLNMGTGFLRGIGDMFVNSSDRAKVVKQKRGVLESKDWLMTFFDALGNDGNIAFDLLMSILVENGKTALPPRFIEQSRALSKNAAKIDDPEERLNVAFEAIQRDPLNPAFSILLDHYGDLDVDVWNLTFFFSNEYSHISNSAFLVKRLRKKLASMPSETEKDLEAQLLFLKGYLEEIVAKQPECPFLVEYEKYGLDGLKKTYAQIDAKLTALGK